MSEAAMICHPSRRTLRYFRPETVDRGEIAGHCPPAVTLLDRRAPTEAPTRNDIDGSSFLPPEIIPRPGVNYFDTFGWDFTLSTKEEVRLRMKDLMKR